MPTKRKRSQSMTRIDGLIHSTLDFDQIAQKVIAEAAAAVGSETAALSLRRDDRWVVSHVHGLPQDVLGARMDDRQEPHAVLAIRTKEPVVINDAFTDERVNREHMKKWGVRAVLVVPLVVEDQAIGVLFFNQHKPDAPFGDAHVDFAHQLASPLALSVHNARLFEKLQAELADVLTEHTQFDAEFRVLRQRQEPRGEIAWLASHAQVIRDEQGLAIRIIGVMYDITSRKQTEAELRQWNERLQELAQQLTRMLKEAIEKSRSLPHELSPAVLYQGDLGETYEWLARQVQTKHGLTVHTEVHGKVDSTSEALKAFLFRTAQEILFNAVKHAGVQEARLRLQRRHGQLWLTIADHGRGFDPGTLGRAAGFGLLSIRERVELLGGRMKIHSVKDRGSVFLITAPDPQREEGRKVRTEEGRRAPCPSDVRPAAPSGLPAGRPLRILLVDDHQTIRAGLAALISEQSDMEVVGQAGDGRQAIELARELIPDVVLMDVAMPTMPGDEATRQIKALLPQTRIVGLSMFEEAGIARRMLDAGAEAYLAKTGPSDALLAAIRGQG
ncbi:MAG: response regulator [Planctomycetes bacterium]|nr:response regulator [Planctomycetota bacterium]